MDWRKVLAYITGTVDEELLLRNEYLAAENRILKGQLKGRLRLTDPQRKTLAEIGYRLGRKAGYERIAGALRNLGYSVADQTIGNVLRRHGIAPAPDRKRKTTWAEFIRSHRAVLAATDFLSVEVLTLGGLVTYYILFFIHIETRKVVIAGITQHPDECWMQQMARNVTMDGWGFLRNCRYLFHDRDTKYTNSFQTTLEAGVW